MSSNLAQPKDPSGETGTPWRAGARDQSGRSVVGEGRLVLPLPDTVPELKSLVVRVQVRGHIGPAAND